jgi:hypothetical protein
VSRAAAKLPRLLPNAKTLSARRPLNNPDMPADMIEGLNEDLNYIKAALEEYAQHLRSLDRKRLNGVGIKLQGFILFAQTPEICLKNPVFRLLNPAPRSSAPTLPLLFSLFFW